MPKFFGMKTTVQLSVADLAKTTTNPKSHVGNAADIATIAAEFVRESKYGTLTELPLYTEDTHSHLRELGLDAQDNFPFFMVHAGKHFFDQSTHHNHSREPERIKGSETSKPSKPSKPNTSSSPKRTFSTLLAASAQAATYDEVIQSWQTPSLKQPFDPNLAPSAETLLEHLDGTLCTQDVDDQAVDYDGILQGEQGVFKATSTESFLEYRRRKIPPILTPHALCLTVFLSPRSFSPKLDPESNRKIYRDVKIDVYFNGEFSGTSLVQGRYRSEVHLFDEQTVRFSGRKISRLVEKPWVIVPSGQTPDGNLRELKRNKGPYLGASQRWAELAQSLEAEAEKGGRDKIGEFSKLGKYLSSLAKLAMPSEVEEMQEAGGPKFGVIDVVITSGKGHKDNSSHPQLLQPTPMRVKSVKKGFHKNSQVNTPETIANVSTEPTTNESEILKSGAYDELMVQSSQSKAIFDRTPKLRAHLSNNKSANEAKGTGTSATDPFGLPLQSSLPSSYRTRAITRRSIPTSVGEDGEENECLIPAWNEGIPTFPTSRSSVRRSRRSDSMLPSPTIDVHSDTHRRSRPPFNRLNYPNSPIFPNIAPRTGSRTSQRPSGLPDRTQRKHADLAQKTYKGPSPPHQPGELRSKRRSRGTWEMVYDDQMTLAEEMDLIEAEAQREQLEASQYDPENQTLSPGTCRSTRWANLGDRDMQTPASPTAVPTAKLPDTSLPDVHPKKKSKIVKLNISVPPASLDAFSIPSTPAEPHSSTASPLSSIPTTPTPDFSPTRASRPPFTPSTPRPPPTPAIFPPPPPTIPSTTRPAAAHTLAGLWTVPLLSQDAALTYAGEGVVRPVKSERNGEFAEMDVIMGVRFLVG